MRRFSREFGHSYKTYSFGYCNFAAREANDTISAIYAEGYLPYSGDLTVRDTFYMARSARIPLAAWSLTSENRRIAKRHEGAFVRRSIAIADFGTNDANFTTFCLAYFKARHGEGIMPEARLQFILSLDLITHIVEYKKGDVLVAYVFEVRDSGMTHFWYSFYDLSYLQQSLGLWLMLDSARETKQPSADHFYLGTAYGEKGLYKTNFTPLQFWDGTSWREDSKQLKALCRADHPVNLS